MRNTQQTLFGVADHANMGIEFEKELETAHDWYRLQGWADVRKIPSSWSFISFSEYQKLQQKLPGAHLAVTDDGRYMQRVKSDVDFVGAGERFGICFDAKVASGKSFPLANIPAHQLAKLKSRARCRIIAGVMIYMAAYDRVFFVPYRYLEQRETVLLQQSGRRAKPGTASISLSDLETHAVEIFRHKMNMNWDWLKALVK